MWLTKSQTRNVKLCPYRNFKFNFVPKHETDVIFHIRFEQLSFVVPEQTLISYTAVQTVYSRLLFCTIIFLGMSVADGMTGKALYPRLYSRHLVRIANSWRVTNWPSQQIIFAIEIFFELIAIGMTSRKHASFCCSWRVARACDKCAFALVWRKRSVMTHIRWLKTRPSRPKGSDLSTESEVNNKACWQGQSYISVVRPAGKLPSISSKKRPGHELLNLHLK